MLRRILLLLGETPSSISARQYGLRMARTAKAEISGFSGIDLTYIESAMPGRVGAGAYAARLEESLKKQAGDAGQRLREQFEAECQEEGVPSELLSFEGDPIEALSSAAETHDLLISGHDTAFRGNVREQLSEVFRDFCWSTRDQLSFAQTNCRPWATSWLLMMVASLRSELFKCLRFLALRTTG